jgi:NADPH-dependent 2,4-dienoyl-CoA reductase/sulfur reductase-like enzyme
VGREAEFLIRPVEKRKKVIIVGGGPGGLEAGRVAALRGHDVTLMEKKGVLGGQLCLASIPTGKEEYKTVTVDWLVEQCKTVGVKIELNTEADFRTIEEFAPDVLIIATGGKPSIPALPGVEGKNVISYEEALTLERDWRKQRVVVAGGGDIGTETAEFLARKKADVTIVEMRSALAPNMEYQNRSLLITRLSRLGVSIKTQHLIEGIEGNGVIVMDLTKLEKKMIEADFVVLALEVISNNDLNNTLKDKPKETYRIGDCVEPKRAVNAIHQASFIARQI